ncbi:MAG: histidine phosphatase family protein [Bacillota bacterium]|nr:histidine phosphatase family protein [Bacillota bacterium]
MKKIYLIRHCEAVGQEPDAELSIEGCRKAHELCEILKNKGIEYIVSSPYKRAVQSIEPFAVWSVLEIELDDRLREKKMAEGNLDRWMYKLKCSFDDLSIRYEGGETSEEVMTRGVQAIQETLKSDKDNIAVVTHGAIMTLILKHFDSSVGFSTWRNLQNPDIYILEFGEGESVELMRMFI